MWNLSPESYWGVFSGERRGKVGLVGRGSYAELWIQLKFRLRLTQWGARECHGAGAHLSSGHYLGQGDLDRA